MFFFGGLGGAEVLICFLGLLIACFQCFDFFNGGFCGVFQLCLSFLL